MPDAALDGGSAGDGDAFLQEFRAAMLHFEVLCTRVQNRRIFKDKYTRCCISNWSRMYIEDMRFMTLHQALCITLETHISDKH